MNLHKKTHLNPVQRTFIKPIATIASSILTLAILLIATSRGMFVDIAAYSAGASIGALVSGIAGSGTSLAFLTGNRRTQRAVKKVRYLFVAPAMVSVSILAGVIYSLGTDLSLTAVVAGGLSVVFNNLAELGSSILQRRLETPRMLISTVVSRLAGVTFIALGSNFSYSMLIASATSFITISFLARGYDYGPPSNDSFFAYLRLAYAPSLMTISVLEIIINRSALIALPFILNAELSGAVASLITAQQNLTSVLISALYTMMAARAEIGQRQKWMRKVSLATLVAAFAISISSALAASLVISALNLDAFSRADLWWALLSLAILPYVDNRRRQYKALGDGERREPTILLLVIALSTVVILVLSVFVSGPTLVVASFAISETVGVIVMYMRGKFLGFTK